MNQTALALLVGLLAGIAGGFIPQLVSPATSPDDAVTTADAGDGGANITSRLARIEASLERLTGGSLTAGTDPALQGSAPIRIALDEASMAEIKAATKETVQETLAELKEADASVLEIEAPARARRGRKRMKLADAAADFGLSADEEEELRQIYQDSMDKAYKLLAGEDGDIEQVRQDLETVKTDPSKRFSIMSKYMPRVLPKLGEFMQIESDRRTRVDETLGKDRARDLQSKYDIEEANPIGMGGRMRFEAGVEAGPGMGR